LRLLYRFGAGAPGHEVTLSLPQKIVSSITHWAMYALLLAVPILGYVGVSLFPALKVFGTIELPAVTSPDKELSSVVFEWHEIGALALLALIGLHIGAAIFHHFIRRDYVLARMMPRVLKRRA
jgi:cytochrome b561